MKRFLPKINPKKETEKIVSFLKRTFEKQRFSKAVIGISGGVDSTTCLFLLRKALPPENIIVAHLPYFKHSTLNSKQLIEKLDIPVNNFYSISIKSIVEMFSTVMKLEVRSEKLENEVRGEKKRIALPTSKIQPQTSNFLPQTNIRLGNIMARVRMIILFDLAKKYNALVCGTENKSERLLGYFTRFGDAASDIEPITHLYKTQVYQLARYLNIPKEIIKADPTAGLWSGQTDEGQFGFSYEEADEVLYLYYDRGQDSNQIKKIGFAKAQNIINFSLNNSFKHNTPYRQIP